MKLFFGGSVAFAATLLATSVIFDAGTLLAQTSATQEPAPAQQPTKEPQSKTPTAEAPLTEASKPAATTTKATQGNETPVKESATPATTLETANTLSTTRPETNATAEPVEPITQPETYVATAYNLPGRTASGMRVAKGLIAADPRILPLGTRVRLEAGPYSGDYIVADTGGGVKGRKIDVWVPSYREARLFGRRNIRLRVISYGAKRAGAVRAGRAPRNSSRAQR